MGYIEDQVCAHLNNSACLPDTNRWTGHDCTWLVYHFHKADKGFIEKLEIGSSPMSAECTSAIAECFIRLSKHPSDLIPANVVRRMKKLVSPDRRLRPFPFR
jgi:hypothetical protein